MVDFKGNVIGRMGPENIKQAKLAYDENGNVIGYIDEKGNVIDFNGKKIGRMLEDGTLVDESGNSTTTTTTTATATTTAAETEEWILSTNC